jgi:predicted ferric reductase
LLSGSFTDHHFTYELGKAFALMGVVIITLQFILSSRPKWLDRVYGLDMLFSFHKAMAVLAGLLIVSHPILLAFGSGHLDLLFSLSQPWYILVGKAGLLLALIQVLISLFRKKISLKFDKWRPIHNIAGGIGITPLMANLRHMRDTQTDKEILLIYANHTQKDIVFRKELDEMVAGQVPKLNVVHILDHPEEDWDGEKGVVDEAFLKRTLTDFKQSFYICTPPPMRTVVLDILKKNGVKANQIVQEVFEL